MTNYPQKLLEDYTGKKINKRQFESQFSNWQKENGIDYTCTGFADKSGVYLRYRNITATIKNNKLLFKTHQEDEASSVFEFQRKVDFYYTSLKMPCKKDVEGYALCL